MVGTTWRGRRGTSFSLKPARTRLIAALFSAAVMAGISSAPAVIRVDVRVAAIYDVAKLVVVGKVAKVDVGTKRIEVEVVDVPKGELPGRGLNVDLVELGDYILQIKQGDPVVIFNGMRGAVVHLADNYLTAESVLSVNSPTWKATRKNDIQTRFPGRTAALVKLVTELKENRPTLMNAMEHTVWRGGVRSLGTGLRNPDYVTAADLTNDGRAEVLIGNRGATRLLVNTPTGLVEQTKRWGLSKAQGRWAAFARPLGNERRDLLIGRSLWLNQGDHFVPGPVFDVGDDAAILTGALIDLTGDGRADAAYLTQTGRLLSFENPGKEGVPWKAMPPRALWPEGDDASAASFSLDWGDTGKAHVMVVRPSGVTRYAIDPDGGPPAAFERLCGETLESFNRLKQQTRWNIAGSVALDLNGDGRMDFIVFHDDGGPTFVNRGFGTFFLSTEPAVGIRSWKAKPVPWDVTPKTRFGAGDIQGDKFEDLLIATEDGRLFELDNTPYPQID